MPGWGGGEGAAGWAAARSLWAPSFPVWAPRHLIKGFEALRPLRAVAINLEKIKGDVVQSGLPSAPCIFLFRIQLHLISGSQHHLGQPATCHIQWLHVSVPRESTVQISSISFANRMVCMAVWVSCVHGGDPVADCVYLVEPGVFWSFFF